MRKYLPLSVVASVLVLGFALAVWFVLSRDSKERAESERAIQKAELADRAQAAKDKEDPTSFKAVSLLRYFEKHQQKPEAVAGKVITVEGKLTSIPASRMALKPNCAPLMLDASPDGVSQGIIVCLIRPADGKDFAASFLSKLMENYEGRPVRIKGTITTDEKVKLFLDNCTIEWQE